MHVASGSCQSSISCPPCLPSDALEAGVPDPQRARPTRTDRRLRHACPPRRSIHDSRRSPGIRSTLSRSRGSRAIPARARTPASSRGRAKGVLRPTRVPVPDRPSSRSTPLPRRTLIRKKVLHSLQALLTDRRPGPQDAELSRDGVYPRQSDDRLSCRGDAPHSQELVPGTGL